VDDQFSNSFEKWKAMGKPQHVNNEQYQELERSGQLQLLTSPEWMEVNNGKTVLKFELPRQAVSFIRLNWNTSE
jgi:xylan 1,4-beta-xylosidase